MMNHIISSSLSSQPTPRRRLVGFGLVAGLLLGLSLLASPVSAATASITQSGGTNWTTGEQVTLRWSSSLTSPSGANVYLIEVNTGRSYHLRTLAANEFSFIWTVGDLAQGVAIPNGTYKARVAVWRPGETVIGASAQFIIGSGCSLTQTVSPAGGLGGIISYTTNPMTVGSSQTVRAIAKTGYVISSFSVNGINQAAAGRTSYSAPVTCNVSKTIPTAATFIAQQCPVSKTITPADGSGGNVSYATGLMNIGTSQTVSAKAQPGWIISKLTIAGVNQTAAVGKTAYSANLSCPAAGTRMIQAVFEPDCTKITPEQTLADLRANKQTYINLPSFRDWVGRYIYLVQPEMVNYQTCYAEEPGARPLSEAANSEIMRRVIRDEINLMLTANKPALGTLAFIRDDGSFGFHSVLVVDFKSSVAYKPTRTIYKISFIDPAGPSLRSLDCEDKVLDGQRIINCPPPSWSRVAADDFWELPETKHIFFLSIDPQRDRNNYLLSLASVRSNPLEWIKNNYTPISNFISNELGTGEGVCLGWSEFNAKASILVKECPFNDTTTATAPATAPASGTTVVPKPPSLTTIPKDTTTQTLASNLIKDGDFATSLSLNNWIAQGTTVNTVRGGAGVLTIEHNGTRSPSYYLRYQNVAVKPGATYEYGGKISATLGPKLTGMSDNICQIDVYSYPTLDTNDISVRTSTGGWQNYSARVTIPAGQTSARLRLITGYALNGTCSYDDIYFREVLQGGYGLSATNTPSPWRAFWDQLAGLWSLPNLLFKW